jgi:hypothetical protein
MRIKFSQEEKKLLKEKKITGQEFARECKYHLYFISPDRYKEVRKVSEKDKKMLEEIGW